MEDDHRETKEAIVFISFERALIQSFKNSIVKQKNIIHNYGHGVYCGVAEEVLAKEGGWSPKRTIGCLKFDDTVCAKRWCNSDPLIKQQDWLGTSDMHIVPLTRALPCGYPCVALMTLDISDKETFFGTYKPAHQRLVQEHGGMTRIAGTSESQKVRGGSYMSFTIVDLFRSRECFDKWYSSDAYQDVKEYRLQSASGNLLVFDLCTKV